MPDTSPPVGQDVLIDPDQLLDCVAVAEHLEETAICIECVDLCQRAENPCIVDVRYRICSPGLYEFVPELTLLSLDTTNGIDGTWHVLQAVETDSKHSGNQVRSDGNFVGVFVFDACDHISSFFSEEKLCVRLTVRQLPDDITGPGGGPTGGTGCIGVYPTGPGLFCAPGGAIPPGIRLPRV